MLTRVRRWARSAPTAVARAARSLGPHWREIALALAFIAGWVSITRGLAALLPGGQVWPFSIGLFLWSLGGLGTLKDIALEGLYVLSRTPRGRRE